MTAPEAAKGLSLPVLPLAAELGVSSTPVREALAHLAGEGLVVRLRNGYRASERDRASLAALYGLAAILIEAAMAEGLGSDAASVEAAPQDVIDRIAPRVGNRALSGAITRVLWQLLPYREAEQHVLGASESRSLEAALIQGGRGAGPAGAVRAYFRRRTARAGEILAAAMGLS